MLSELSENHQAEFQSSAIDKELIDLNIGTVDLSWTFDNDLENEDIGFILDKLNWNTSRKNDGRLRDATINSVLKLAGGWYITPFWGLADRQTTDYFRFKPDCPPPDPKKNGKLKKYLGAVSSPVRLYTPNIPRQVWASIAKRYPGDKISEVFFWEWILNHPEIPVIITEGEKKALSGLSAGYVTVSLPGIDCGYKSVFDPDGENKHLELIPDLAALAAGGRTIQIAFDRDSNPKTIQRVARSRQKLAMLFAELGSETCTINWSHEYKGFDDFIANSKPTAVAQAIADAVNITPKANVEKEKLIALYSFASSIERGLDLVTMSEDGEEQRESIGNHLQAIAYVNNPEQDGAALLLEFQTIRGGVRRWTIPRAELAGDGAVILGGLLGRDYSFKRRQKQLLLDYLHGLGSHIEQTFTVTDSSGWVGRSFVLPHKTHGDENMKFRDVDVSPDSITEIKGTLQGWKDGVAARCANNSRLILGLGISFAAPLLPIVDIESGGFHLVGGTSKGKTTILSVAASVTGVKDIPHWRTTTNGLESIATAYNHLCLPLDEIGQADPKDVGNIAYMLANGAGKSRMTKNLTNRKGKTWRLMVLSSGEITLGNYMKQAGITQKGGQEVRLPDVPALPKGSQYGCFETIHQAEIPEQFVASLEANVKDHRGSALDAFLSRLVLDVADPQFAGQLAKQVHLTAARLSEGTIDSAIGRVAKRFALVQVALGIAHRYDLLPFPAGQIGWAIGVCFQDWLRARGGDGSIEIKNAVERIEHLLVTNEFSDRVFTLPNNNDRPIRNLLGYRKVDFEGNTEEFWIPPSVFDKEFCDGVNKTELTKELQRLGWLDLSVEGKTRSRKINGKPMRYFIFRLPGMTVLAGDAHDLPANPFGVTDSAPASPAPPLKTVMENKSNETTPEIIKIGDYIEYQIVENQVKYLELTFHKCSIAKEWQSQIELWGGTVGKPHKISRNGIKWLLCVTNLPISRLEQILASNLGGSPQQLTQKP
jgi:putative DNA primase/helicase